MGYGKWISGAIGWALGGPIGGVIGFSIASFLESDSNSDEKASTGFSTSRGSFTKTEERNSFLVTLLVLSSAVMKADGRVMKSELDYVKQFIISNFGVDAAAEATKYLQDILKKEIDISSVGAQIQRYMNVEARRSCQLI